jgi:hypothetical protein
VRLHLCVVPNGENCAISTPCCFVSALARSSCKVVHDLSKARTVLLALSAVL